jgi:hypothetical protein
MPFPVCKATIPFPDLFLSFDIFLLLGILLFLIAT